MHCTFAGGDAGASACLHIDHWATNLSSNFLQSSISTLQGPSEELGMHHISTHFVLAHGQESTKVMTQGKLLRRQGVAHLCWAIHVQQLAAREGPQDVLHYVGGQGLPAKYQPAQAQALNALHTTCQPQLQL